MHYLKGKENIVLTHASGENKKRVHRADKLNREYKPEEKSINKTQVATTRRGALYDKFVEEGLCTRFN